MRVNTKIPALLLAAAGILAISIQAAAIPESALDWKKLKRFTKFEPVAANALAPKRSNNIVMVFRHTKEISFELPFESPGVKKLTVAYISGGSFKPFTLYIDGKKLATTAYSEEKSLKLLHVTTPDMIGKPVITFKSDKINNIGILYIDAKPAKYYPSNENCWNSGMIPAGKNKRILESKIEENIINLPSGVKWNPINKSSTEISIKPVSGQTAAAGALFFSPRRFSAYWFKLTASSPVVLSVNGKIVADLDKPGSIILKLKWYQFRYKATRVIVAAKQPGQPLKFKLSTSDLKGGSLLTKAPDYLQTPKKHLSGWPRTTITNGLITATMTLPDWERGFYRGDRFDPCGILTSVKYNGHKYFFAPGNPPGRDPKTDSSVGSIAGEFRTPVAYDDAKPGEEFMRIGVGTFIRTEEIKPFFGNPYKPVKKFPYTAKINKDKVIFEQSGAAPRDWSYKYRKIISLAPGKPVIKVQYKLTNTGKKRITTRHYAHNFIAVDGDKVKKNYKLDFNFPVSFEKNIRRGVEKRGNSLYLNGRTIFSELKGFSSKEHNFANVVHLPSGRGVKVTGDYAPFNYYLFVNSNAVCPEMFKWIDIGPGESCEWNAEYLLY